MSHSKEIERKEYKPIPIKKLRRIFQIIEKLLSSYMHPMLKKNKYFTVKELEMFIELGHSSSDFNNLLKDRGINHDKPEPEESKDLVWNESEN
jgi:hypothetical protein